MVVKPSKVVPGNKDHRGIPVGSLHNCVQSLHRPILARTPIFRRVFIVLFRHGDPTHGWKASSLRIAEELIGRYEIRAPGRAISDLPDRTEGVRRAAVIHPWNPRRLEAVRERGEIKTWRGLSGGPIGIQHCD